MHICHCHKISIILSLLFGYFYTTLVAAGPVNIIRGPEPAAFGAQQSSSPRAAELAPATSSRHPRALFPRQYRHFHQLPLGWNLYWTTFTQVLPGLDLVQHIREVYKGILTATAKEFINHPAQQHVVINIGYLQMVFRCDTRAIPWAFVATFVRLAYRQLHSANGYLFGFYDIMLSHPSTGDTVFVALRLNPTWTSN